MRAVDAIFLRTLRGSHRPVFRARVITTYQTGVQPDGDLIDIVDSNGEVSQSSTADIRSSLTLTVPEPWPKSATDHLAPYGNEIYIERGLAYGNGQTVWVGLGYYRINTPQQDIVPDGPVTITGSDRMAGVIDSKFIRPQQFSQTMTRRQLSEFLVQDALGPQAVVEWDDPAVADAVIGRPLVVEQDRYGALKDLADSVGKSVFFDYRGVCLFRTRPDITGVASWTVDAGGNGVMVSMSRNLTRDGVFNAVVCTGEGADTNTPAYAVVADYSENSPTRYGGRFGKVPDFYSSPLVVTQAQAVTAGTERLKTQLGLPYKVVLSLVPNPALEPEDIIAVSYPDRARSLSLQTEKHIIDTIRHPIGVGAGAQSIETRQQPKILVGEVPL
jgi:hypothetical protein